MSILTPQLLPLRQRLICAVITGGLLALAGTFSLMGANANTAPTLSISQIPLTVASPVHPQVLFALGNSQSMDGTLSGAIMTGSGSLPSSLNSLSATSSPVNYAVPAGFTPPLSGPDASGNAPYTVSMGDGVLADNGASRLNVAKAGINAIINAYMQNTDFALETYNTSPSALYSTWVYYMSPAGTAPDGKFNFTNTPISGKRYVANPCFSYQAGTTSSTVKDNCASIAGRYGSSTVNLSQWMEISASSDDPQVNDVLYAPSSLGVYVNYGGTSPSSPYPPQQSLAAYNAGNIHVTYPNALPTYAYKRHSPTNAGYVPFTSEVMESRRGFGYYAYQYPNDGTVLVPMTSAGTVPTSASVTAAVAALTTPHLKPETNIVNNQVHEIRAVASQSPTAGLLTKAKSYLATTATGTNGCLPKQYVVLISDGLPTQDMAGNNWPPLGSAAAAGYGVTASFNSDGTVAATNDTALTDTITALTNLSNAGIKTFIIGLGAGVDPSVNPQAASTLQAMAIAGGSTSYYPASSPAALVDDLNQILLSVQSGTLSTTSAAVNSTYLKTGSVEFQANFTSSATPYQDWTGDVFEKALDPNTGAPTGAPIWSAAANLDVKANGTGWLSGRNIVTWDPTLANNAGAGAPFQWASLGSAQQGLLQPADANGIARLEYLRGNTALEKRNAGGIFRNRSHLLGDVVNSQPIYVSTPNDAYFSSSYRKFVAANSTRTPMVYAGANDGMLHAFVASTGNEQFAFVPNAMFANLKSLTDPLYNQSHRYFVDGPPKVADVQFSDQTWHTLLVGGEGGGGKSIYAIDVTKPQLLTTESAVASAVLWEFADAAGGVPSGDLGLTYSEPVIAPINVSTNVSTNAPVNATGMRFAVFFGNGYNSANNHSVLYALDPKTGETLAKIDLCAAVPSACSTASPQGLSSVSIGTADGLASSPITQIYAGDLQGNLWAVDVSNSNPASWAVRLLFQARDAGGNTQPVTTAPLVTLHPDYPRQLGNFVMIGTGQLLQSVDLTSTATQSIYGIWDKEEVTTVATRSMLTAQTLTALSAASTGLPQDVLTDTRNTVEWATKLGWYIDLIVPGQRVVTQPQLLNGAFLTALNTPPANSCTAGFSSDFLEVNYINGGSFDTPQLDINGDHSITETDHVSGANPNPVGVKIGGGFLSTPTPVKNKGRIGKIGTLSAGNQPVIQDLDNAKKRTSWWQVQ